MNIQSVLIGVLLIIILAQSYFTFRLWRKSKRTSLGLDEITEDTLKTLYHLSRENDNIKSSNLIRAADLQPDRFTLILSELRRRNWADASDENSIHILPDGEKRALELIRAHRLWERYLADKSRLPLSKLHEEAMRREHITTPEEANRLATEMGNPRYDPHGDPIPLPGEDLQHHSEGISLLKWPEHQLGLISHIEDEPEAIFEQLSVLGLTPGAHIEIDERTPGKVLVWSGRQRFSLAPTLANAISVVEAPPEFQPLAELEIGQGGTILSLSKTQAPREEWVAASVASGSKISAVRADPLGDPIYYQVNGQEIAISHSDANLIQIATDSIHDIPLPRHSWLAEEWLHFKELIAKYGTFTAMKQALVFLGPAFVISVGYMDPGNWGTDIEGGARFGYQLLWVILLANLMAILMQTLSAKLGIATGKSLPAVCRDHYPRWLSVFLWVTAELAAMATDLAEFLGGAVGFYLLFHLPLFPSALLTGVIISLILLLERYGYRKVELVIIGLISVIGFVYMTEIWLSKPAWGDITHGLLVPSMPIGATLVAVGIIGATVMPHNLYLHSALIQTRVRPTDSLARKHKVYRFAILDSIVALNGAFFVNAAILAMSAAVFSGGRLQSYSLESAHQTLTPLLGPIAGAAFAIALLASGLSSSTTATMAGQVIMDGFIHHRMNVWLRRAVTMIPSLIVIGMGLDPLKILILSQVSLSFQLPFAMIPLVLFTNNSHIMGEFVNNRLTSILAWVSTVIILTLNIILLFQIFFPA